MREFLKRSLVVSRWLLAVGCWLLVVGCWSFAMKNVLHRWLFTTKPPRLEKEFYFHPIKIKAWGPKIFYDFDGFKS